MIVIFLGPPACGKGTQSAHLVDAYDYKHISTGDLIREEIDQKTELGLKLKQAMTTGELIKGDSINNLVKKELEKYEGKAILLDGYPRTLDQALYLDELLAKHKQNIKKVFYFDIDTATVSNRVLNRVTCGDCGAIYNLKTKPPRVVGICDVCGSDRFQRRGDDKEEVIETRIKAFVESTKPLKDFYEKNGLLTMINARKSVEKVTEQIMNELKE